MTVSVSHLKLLKSVSRSFYLSLRVLPKPLRPGMAYGYLVCRAADTIADTDQIPHEARLSTLKLFKTALRTFPIEIEHFNEFFEKLNEYSSINKKSEGLLLSSLSSCIKSLQSLSKTEQALIQEVALGVIQGMEMDLALFGRSLDTTQSFGTTKELERYLISIGGEPGRFWSKLCLAQMPRLEIKNKSQWMEDGIKFGTGLQMVNILRDLKEDLERGRCYIPQELLNDHQLKIQEVTGNEKNEVFLTLYHELIADTLNRLEHGMEYIFQIPKTYPRLRLAAWWPLIMGVKTLKKLRYTAHVRQLNQKIKINRLDVYKLMAGSLLTVFSNKRLEKYYRAI